MALYAILNQYGNPIAYHHNKRVIKRHLEDLNDSRFIIVKVKHKKQVEETQRFAELYLMKSGGGYVPSRLYDSASVLLEEELYDYDTLLSLIDRELITGQISQQDKKALIRTYSYFKQRIKKIKSEKPDQEAIEQFEDMRNEYKNTIGKE